MVGAPDHVAVEPRCVLVLVVTHSPLVVEDLVQDLQYNNDLVAVDDVQVNTKTYGTFFTTRLF